mmetsp:Transcript_101270/g.178285  ORF Transcript_101270/g.178285 Transcript_101270/m.178285 type:complete len:204 (-) Transcript_101270:229-840(-)
MASEASGSRAAASTSGKSSSKPSSARRRSSGRIVSLEETAVATAFMAMGRSSACGKRRRPRCCGMTMRSRGSQFSAFSAMAPQSSCSRSRWTGALCQQRASAMSTRRMSPKLRRSQLPLSCWRKDVRSASVGRPRRSTASMAVTMALTSARYDSERMNSSSSASCRKRPSAMDCSTLAMCCGVNSAWFASAWSRRLDQSCGCR